MIIGKRIKELRKKMKMTQEDLANQMRISRSALANYESGLREPNGDILVNFSRILNTSTDYLLGNTDDPRSLKEIHQFQKDKPSCEYNELISIDHYKNLPSIARKEIEDYIEFIVHKYGKGKD